MQLAVYTFWWTLSLLGSVRYVTFTLSTTIQIDYFYLFNKNVSFFTEICKSWRNKYPHGFHPFLFSGVSTTSWSSVNRLTSLHICFTSIPLFDLLLVGGAVLRAAVPGQDLTTSWLLWKRRCRPLDDSSSSRRTASRTTTSGSAVRPFELEYALHRDSSSWKQFIWFD